MAVKFTTSPPQIVLLPVIATFKVLATVTVTIAGVLVIQPADEVPDTEYEVVVVGETIELPLEKVNEFAPLGLKVNELPKQIAPFAIVIVGVVFTVTELITPVEFTHPFNPVPVTV